MNWVRAIPASWLESEEIMFTRLPLFAAQAALGLTLFVGLALPSQATVMVFGPDPNLEPIFSGLAIPPGGAFDERAFSGFEYLISGRTSPSFPAFETNDMYLVAGNQTDPSQAIGIDLGDRAALSGVEYQFSISQSIFGGRNLTFAMTPTGSTATSALCWGINCPIGSVSQQVINGMSPITDYNGLGIQVRSQSSQFVDATTSVRITSFTGTNVTGFSGAPLYDETVDPTIPGSIQTFFGTDNGRRVQLLLGDALEFQGEWQLQGFVTITRPNTVGNPDDGIFDRSSIRLAVDLVQDPTLPIPEPSTALLVGTGLLVLATRRRPDRT